MKILKNKTYQGLIDKVEKLIEENEKLNTRDALNNKFIEEYKQLSDNYKEICETQETKIGEFKTKIASCKNKNMQLENENRQLKEENKQLLGAKGGYTKEINKLKKQVEELDFKLKESMTDKYLVRKIPSGRKPKSQPMKIKDWSKISNISRKVFGD